MAQARPKSKAQLRREKEDAEHAAVLEWWFKYSGTTMDQLTAEIERLQPGTHPVDRVSIYPEIIGPVFEAEGVTPNSKLLIARAMQHAACRRPWRQTQA